MTTDEILGCAGELNCEPPHTAVTFARAIAERCAAYAADVSPDAGSRIRTAFGLAS
jgi:hypothetical protein